MEPMARGVAWKSMIDLANAYDDEPEAFAVGGAALAATWREADMRAQRAARQWCETSVAVTAPVAKGGQILKVDVAKLKKSKRPADLQRRLTAIAQVQAASPLDSEEAKHKAKAEQFAKLTWTQITTMEADLTDEFERLPKSDIEAFTACRITELMSFDWGYLRALNSTMADFRAFIGERGASLDAGTETSKLPTRVAVEAYIRARADGSRGATRAGKRMAGGDTAGKTVARQLRWWTDHGTVKLPKFSARVIPSGGRDGYPARPLKQAVPLSVALAVHCEQWTLSTQTGAAMFAGFLCSLTHGVLRFRHGQRTTLRAKTKFCISGRVGRGKNRTGLGFDVFIPAVGILCTRWGDTFFELWKKYEHEHGSEPDFLMPALIKGSSGYQMSSAAMSYQQYRDMLIAFFAQAPANLHSDVAARLSGHTPRRFHTTVAGIRRVPEADLLPLGNWVGQKVSEVSSMPIRYQGARDLTQLGVKMESVAACQYVMKKAEPGEELTWPRVAKKLAGVPDVAQATADALAEADNPLGTEDLIDIFKLGDTGGHRSAAGASSAAPQSAESSDESEADESGSEGPWDLVGKSGSESEAIAALEEASQDQSGSEPSRAAKLHQLQSIIGDRCCIAHATRGTVHISASPNSERTACGDHPQRWADAVQLTAEELLDQFWVLCSRPACFQAATLSADRTKASRVNSRPDTL